MSHAREVLMRLGAIDAAGAVTAHGVKMVGIPLHPRLAHMVIKGMELGCGGLACYISALLTERDFLRAVSSEVARDPDIRHRIEILLWVGGGFSRADFDTGLCERIRSVAKKLKRDLGIRDSKEAFEDAGLLLAFAYPDRIAKRRPGGGDRYVLSNGRGAYLRKAGTLSAEEYIVAASLDGGDKESAVFLAAPLLRGALEKHFAADILETETIEWDQAIKGVAAVRKKTLWGLLLTESRIENPGGKEVLDSFIEGLRKNGLEALPWDKRSGALLDRIRLVGRMCRDNGGALRAFSRDFSDEALIEGLPEWLGPWLVGMTRLEHLKKLDMSVVLTGMLTREESQALERLAPTHITVPSGSRIPVDYSGDRPVLAVRLQELFGLDKTPSVGGGRLPLVLHLLSPAGRPVQVTEDLAGFWASGYAHVKKELKGRYPKHHWPDDPLRAEPARGVKRATRPDDR
ncbi:MAG TPA: ATP-dependent helicase C-terminal domain-containing protein, partial [Thermodesulfobacteriota bacterium]|nr:ATP-dependent helicase C-terminal domain-containing protein [Thermodesulfobacteriota bacterium]